MRTPRTSPALEVEHQQTHVQDQHFADHVWLRDIGFTLKSTSRFTISIVTDGLGISALAERSGVTPSAVRYYERIGLLSPAQRSANGYQVLGPGVDLTSRRQQ